MTYSLMDMERLGKLPGYFIGSYFGIRLYTVNQTTTKEFYYVTNYRNRLLRYKSDTSKELYLVVYLDKEDEG